jgi:hypothetical protein
VPWKHVQLEQDREDPDYREHDHERIAEARVDVRAEEQAERRDADETGDPVQGLHLDQKP